MIWTLINFYQFSNNGYTQYAHIFTRDSLQELKLIYRVLLETQAVIFRNVPS